MTSLEKDDKPKMDLEKPNHDDKENETKEHKSKGRDRDESKRSKKHKKKRSHSSGSSDSSRSRSRSRSNRKSHKKHKSKRSRSRSPKRSKHSRSRRSRSRSPRKHRSHRSRSKSKRDDKKKDSGRDTGRDTGRDVGRDKDRGRKGFKFDSPPKEMQLTEQSIDLSEFGIPSIDVLKEMYPATKTMDPSELLQKLQLIRDMSNLRTSKVDRKLYIGNIPTGLTPQMLMDLLNSALQKMGINVDPPGNSILGAWISPDNNYAFVDFRTPEEATAGFALNSVAIHGQTLKVGRPRSYQQDQETTSNPLAALFGVAGLPINPLGPIGQGEGTLTTNFKIQTQSRVLVLKNMVQVAELEIDEEYNEILEDVKDRCEEFGKVLSIKIPRPQTVAKDAVELGKIFVEYATIDEAKAARKELQGSTFDGRTVEVSFYDDQKYAQNDLSEL